MTAPVVATLTHGQPGYGDLLDQIRADPELVERMWQDAESRPDELDVPGTWWSVVTVGGVPAAWCAARSEGGVLKCHSNYEVPSYRRRGLYVLAYHERHLATVLAHDGPAVTYLFAQPIALHEADGWERTGLTRVSEATGHRWWELRRRCRHRPDEAAQGAR